MKLRSLYISLLAACIFGQPSVSAPLTFAGPLLGYYFDPSVGGIRPIIGTPGAASEGSLVNSSFDSIWIAPNAVAALALNKGNLVFVGNVGNPGSFVQLAAWSDPINEVDWSSDSSGVLILSSQRGSIRTVTGLPGRPVLNPEIGLSSLQGSIAALRLSVAPWNIAATVNLISAPPQFRRPPERPINLLYLLPSSGSPVLIGGVSSPGPMDFSSDGASLYVVDRKADQIMNVAVAHPSAIRLVSVTSPELKPSDFTDLAASDDGQFLYVPQKDGRTICAIAISSGDSPWCTALDFAPSSLRRFSASLFLLNSPAEAATPLWLLHTNPNGVFFVPRGSQN
jgi:hypothetical protein